MNQPHNGHPRSRRRVDRPSTRNGTGLTSFARSRSLGGLTAVAIAASILTVSGGPPTPAAATTATVQTVAASPSKSFSPRMAPGNPGVPGDPVVLFEEAFENRALDSNILLTDYEGAGGQTYTGDPYWVSRPACNGLVINWSSPIVAGDCNGESFYDNLTAVPRALGVAAGSSSPGTNGAASSYTEAGPPERMIPPGAHSRIHASDTVGGWISQ